jgi:hypothetical protein
MNKCPRCKLPQKGIHRCQYCGYIFSKNKKTINAIRNKLEDVIGALSNKQMFVNNKAKKTDHGGTRSGSDRRKYKYMHYSPERRSGKDRRKRVALRGK